MRSMQDRRVALEAFKEGDVRFMICTDVAARGIDIKSLPYVINIALPVPDEAAYIHHRTCWPREQNEPNDIFGGCGGCARESLVPQM